MARIDSDGRQIRGSRFGPEAQEGLNGLGWALLEGGAAGTGREDWLWAAHRCFEAVWADSDGVPGREEQRYVAVGPLAPSLPARVRACANVCARTRRPPRLS